jgi:SSS family solute:Na+ symporter
MYLMVKVHPAYLRYIALSPDARDMAENLYRALWSWLICIAVTVLVSLFTEPKSDEQLAGLVRGFIRTPKEKRVPLVQRPIFWAVGVAVLFGVLQWMFW